MKKCFSLLAALSVLLLTFDSFAKEDNAKAAKKAWSAFECSIFASYANKKEDAEELFTVGYKEITKFLNALEAKEITEEEFRSVVPMGISFSLGGPNKDFMAGRIYEYVSSHASDEIIKEDSSGLLIADSSKWNMDKGLQLLIANNKYSKGNCDLLK